MVIFALPGMGLAQRTVSNDRNTDLSTEKNTALKSPEKDRLLFVQRLARAQSAESVGLAFRLLNEAVDLCPKEDCRAELKPVVARVFQNWLDKALAEPVAQDQLEQLAALRLAACRTDYAAWIDCREIDRRELEIKGQAQRKDYAYWLEQAGRETELSAQLDALERATQICQAAGWADCTVEIAQLKKQFYRTAFADQLRAIRQSGAAYTRRLALAAELEELLVRGELGASAQDQYEELLQTIHRDQVELLMETRAGWPEKLQDLEAAAEIDANYLGGAYARRIEQQRTTLVADRIAHLLQSAAFGNFRRQLEKAEAAAELLVYLPREEVGRQERRIQRQRSRIVTEELDRRRERMGHYHDWRNMLAGYEDLLRFVRQYRQDLPVGTTRALQQERISYLLEEYELRLQGGIQALSRQDLTTARQLLAGTEELFQTGYLPAGLAARHRSVYQRLYEAHYDLLQAEKARRDWPAAQRRIDQLYLLVREAPFMLLHAPLAEEERQLAVAIFMDRVADWDARLRRQEVNLAQISGLLDSYRDLRTHLPGDMDRQVQSILVATGEQYLEKARRALAVEDYGAVYNALSPLWELWDSRAYRDLLPGRTRSDLESILSYSLDQQTRSFLDRAANLASRPEQRELLRDLEIFSGQIKALTRPEPTWMTDRMGQVLALVLDNMSALILADLREGFFEPETSVRELEITQQRFGQWVGPEQVARLKKRLDVQIPYEQGLAGLQRGDFHGAIDRFSLAESRLSGIPAPERAELRLDIQRGLESGLEGVLLEEMQRLTSDPRTTYRIIMKTRLQYTQIPLSDRVKAELGALEKRWFGPECGADYREYTRQILLAEEAAAENNYLSARNHYRRAFSLESFLQGCGAPVDEVGRELRYYEMAVSFQRDKIELELLRRRGEYAVFDQAYQDLWRDYRDLNIKSKFGFSMLPFEEYLWTEKDPGLLAYFVVSRAGYPEEREQLHAALIWLSKNQSKREMQDLGAETARSLLAVQPERVYRRAFEELISSIRRELDRKGYRGFRKGFRRAWKELG